MTNWESLKTLRWDIFIFITISSPRIKAWYSTMLLEQHLVSEKAKSKTSRSSMMNITPAPPPFFHAAPLKNIFHDSDILINKTSLLGRSLKNFHSSGIGWWMRKSTSACPLIAFCETYTLLNSWSNKAHFAILPNSIGLEMMYLRGSA